MYLFVVGKNVYIQIYILYHRKAYKGKSVIVDMKTLKVEAEVWEALMRLKLDKKVKNIDAVIKELLRDATLG